MKKESVKNKKTPKNLTSLKCQEAKSFFIFVKRKKPQHQVRYLLSSC
jgi:hypothetical protein